MEENLARMICMTIKKAENKLTTLKSTKFLLYGLQRSGTNYLQKIVERNFENVVFVNGKKRNCASHKHFRLYDNKRIIPESKYENDLIVNSLSDFERTLAAHEKPDYYFVISKNPYSWYVSYKRWAEACDWPDVAYHYIHEYNSFYRKWVQFAVENPGRIMLIKYIDLLRDPQATIGEIEVTFKLQRITGEIREPRKVGQSTRFSTSRKRYYLYQEYLDEISSSDMRILNNNLDRVLSRTLGYFAYG